jgi:glycerophosphoryl diester phosphodiesterase
VIAEPVHPNASHKLPVFYWVFRLYLRFYLFNSFQSRAIWCVARRHYLIPVCEWFRWQLCLPISWNSCKLACMLRNWSFCLVSALLLNGLVSSAQSDRKILVHGHRGARAMRPENTIPAFEYAIKTGVDCLEMDMAVTKDNVIVISHDPVLHGPVCTSPQASAVIHELTLAQVRDWDCGAVRNPLFEKQTPMPGTRMPTLDDVFQLAPRGTFDYNIETKIFLDRPELTPPPAEFSRMVLEKIRKYKLEKRVILQSFDFRTLVAMKKLAPESRLSALVEKDPRDFPTIAREGLADILSPHYSLVSREKVAAAHTAGLQVVPWTANTPAQWDSLIDAGVDAIITDDPAQLISYLKLKGLR